MHALSKHLYNISNITAWEVVYWRSLSLVVCNAAAAQVDRSSVLEVPKRLGKVLLWRALTGIVGMTCLFLQIKVMSFSKATSIFFIYPVFAMITGYLVLNEKITQYDIISSVLSFTEVIHCFYFYTYYSLLIVIVFDPHSSKKINSTQTEMVWAPVVPVLAALFCVFSDICTRALGSAIHSTVSPVYFGLGDCIASSLLIQLNYYIAGTMIHYTPEIILYLLLISASGFIAQWLHTKAFQLEKAGRVAAITYLQVVKACFIDVLLFEIPIRGLQLVGVVLVVTSGTGLMALKGFNIIK
eukprot:TRINITY_DN12470_c0_g2_i1.p1 TRINITY_DN12470_c0_g2~~TRINITY_DN12470_c0_g2_i1.p1  ORF type:complete len:298 (-),score=27.69 TRINITY_DN12470_c0_g2_i1:285-1178(-)